MRDRKPKLIAFPLYPGVTPLDLVGPLTVLRKLGPRWPFQTVVVGERIESVATDTTLRLIPQHTYQDVPAPFAVFVPGGGDATIRAMEDPSLIAYVRAVAARAEVVGATGNGALILGAAGLLAGRRATAHWAYREQLEHLGAIYQQARWVEDGRFLTAAGGSAGIDMLLAFVAKYGSESSAKLAQITAEYDPQPPFGGVDWDSVDRDLTELRRVPQAI
jgi:transcriptional regulator GlxA family with amidase domain